MAEHRHRVVIVGGGFGGLYAAKSLGRAPVDITLIDKRNFHLFQPLLYQVATGTLSPADISSPLRGILSQQRNTQVLMDHVIDVDAKQQHVVTPNRVIPYDTLIVATGVRHHYFGNDDWKKTAPGLKTVEDALNMRRRIFLAFEAAEKESDPEKRQALLTFVIVGGGPTGVELAGAIAELAFKTLKNDFRNIDVQQTKVLLLEGLDRVLPPYAPELSGKAAASLQRLGVTIMTETRVTQVDANGVTVQRDGQTSVIPSETVLWAAGVKASSVGKLLSERTGVALDRVGRVMVDSDLSVPGYGNIFVIGDLANFSHQPTTQGKDSAAPPPSLPGVAPVAIQEGQYVASKICAQLAGKPKAPFRYKEVGSLAIIGQNLAVVDLGFVKFSGPIAWLVWIFAHVYYLIEFDNKLLVLLQWGWNYFTRQRGARLITGEATLSSPVPSASPSPGKQGSDALNDRVSVEVS
ncbi:MAG: NAD(P)/FAD-dependent oxidoreductase [Thermosynechococcaceae cyanobacterium MS004]|nr:NAD(P)/FAD-dependent oxidoreductase [Thermosynechococcaceae cyanobacterium MS004]